MAMTCGAVMGSDDFPRWTYLAVAGVCWQVICPMGQFQGFVSVIKDRQFHPLDADRM